MQAKAVEQWHASDEGLTDACAAALLPETAAHLYHTRLPARKSAADTRRKQVKFATNDGTPEPPRCPRVAELHYEDTRWLGIDMRDSVD